MVNDQFSDKILVTYDPDTSLTGPANPAKLGLQIGYPALAPLSRERVLVSTWSGRCLIIDVDTGLTEVQPMVAQRVGGGATGGILSTPCAAGVDRQICAVATRSGWAGVWTVGDKVAQHIYTDSGPANAVALSPAGDLLAIGTGYYPLSSPVPRCGLEIWQISEAPELLAKVRLPDVAVDYIWWDVDRDLILAWSGAVTQNRGNLWVFDADDFRLQEAVALDYLPTLGGAMIDYGGWILTISTGRLELRSTDYLNEVHYSKSFNKSYSAAICSEMGQVLLPHGELINFYNGQSATLEPLPDCVAVSARPDGGFLGLSSTGVLRVWS